VTACDVVRRPSRGHEAAMEDFMPKGVEGYVVPPWPRYGGGDQLMLQAGKWGRFGEVERCRLAVESTLK
jgi:hypothetical protein